MSVTRAEIVMVNWPYSDRTGSKVRPALVVQADFLNGRIADTVLAQITRRSRGAPSTEVIIDPAVDTASGLPHISVAVCTNFLTVDQSLIGHLSATTVQRVNDCLKTALELP
jgi:mRNA-degrading endonuclease toxin of MazEF toxin-antitoxin module